MSAAPVTATRSEDMSWPPRRSLNGRVITEFPRCDQELLLRAPHQAGGGATYLDLVVEPSF